MSAPPPTDAADAAGGEAIYSSDGLPPIPTPVPPLKSPADAGNDDSTILDSEALDATDAFEVFGGKAYLRPGSRGGAWRRSHPPSGTSWAETPLGRLARLSAEVRELERDLAAAPSSATSAEGAVAGDGPSGEELAKLARDLASRLEVAGNKHGVVDGDVSTLFRGQQEDLTKMVREEAGKVQSERKESGDGEESGSNGVVYELYASSSSGHAGLGTPQTSGVEASIEERIGRIERAVGTKASSSGVDRSVMARLEEAETMVAKADGKAMEAAAARAKVIRADLEAAAKAKSKLSAALSTIPPDDAKTISSLHTQLLDLEGVSSHLPAIVSRLQDLSTLHGQAADFATRLTTVENAATDAERLLKGVEDVLGKVEEGWKVNAEAVEKNVAALDERMKGLSV